jgi:heme-degrading monooxygenase HmoA
MMINPDGVLKGNSMEPVARTPRPPYYAVVFTSVRSTLDDAEYAETAERMVELAAQQPGFLGVESARDGQGVGITVSYWDNLEAVRRWREHAEHRVAQANGKERWYERYHLRICRVEADQGFERRAQ